MTTLELTTFDYQQLDSETWAIVQKQDDKLDFHMIEGNKHYVLAGQNLARIQEALHYKRPGFVEYLKVKQIPQNTAYKLIHIGQIFTDSVKISSIEALALLAAPSTPDEVRQDFVEQAQNGATVTYSNVKTALGIHKTINPLVAYGGLSSDAHLNEALTDQIKPICPECGQVYDGNGCPDCQPFDLAHDVHQNGYNYKRDNRRSVASDIYTPQGMDACQTPAYALDPLLPYLPREWVIWEPACGEGLLVEALYDSDFAEGQVVASDILTGQNFFDYEPEVWDCLITNPPFSIKDKWLKRCYELGKPFALILPAEIPGTAYAAVLFEKFGVEIIYVRPRINFKMPNKGFGGGGSQFPTAWFTYGLNIGQQISFAKVAPDAD
jgi:hypothetical protein